MSDGRRRILSEDENNVGYAFFSKLAMQAGRGYVIPCREKVHRALTRTFDKIDVSPEIKLCFRDIADQLNSSVTFNCSANSQPTKLTEN